jgi:hypothetical protein
MLGSGTGDIGTDEYLALCARLHIAPSITANVNGNGATPEEAVPTGCSM